MFGEVYLLVKPDSGRDRNLIIKDLVLDGWTREWAASEQIKIIALSTGRLLRCYIIRAVRFAL
jgi:hypothetical protein